jgi:hypothetical protein
MATFPFAPLTERWGSIFYSPANLRFSDCRITSMNMLAREAVSFFNA